MKIDQKMLADFSRKFNEETSNQITKYAISRVGIQEASFNSEVLRKHNFVYSEQIEHGKICNQKQSGRCWMFAALNAARIEVMKKLNLETFEFSQNYCFFWDKLEKSNYFLENILETLDEETDSRLLKHLLAAPIQDGGQWDMFVGILEKYGAVPKSAMPETFHSSASADMCTAITTLLRKDASIIRRKYRENASIDELRKLKEDMLYEIYQILCKCLGEPPVNFDFEYRDKNKEFHAIRNITPQEFFKEYVSWNLDDKISLINAPTKDKPYGKAYTVAFLSSVKEAREVRYVNVPMEELKRSAIASIKAGEPVWYGCDVGKLLARQEGIMDYETFRYKDTLGVDLSMSKEDRLDYSESLLTHAMLLVGVYLDENGNPVKWKVENSWGSDRGCNGIYSMSDEWMDQFTYQIMVDKKYIDPKYIEAYNGEITVLKPWDPMGALAWLN